MSAIISPDGVYRYRLERPLDAAFPMPMSVFMVNPSTADANLDDPTIRRVVGFGKAYGCSHIIVGNLFALRATDVKELGRVPDPVGPLNDMHLAQILADSAAGRAVVAWGAAAKIPRAHRSRITDFARLAERMGVPLWCWGTTSDGSPKHPLYLSGDATLSIWKHPDA